MAGPGDWDPLPPEGLSDPESPAEAEERRQAAARQAAEDEGERRLRELIAHSKAIDERTTLAQAVAGMARRQDRRAAAGKAPFAEEARHQTSFLQAVDVPLEPDYREGRDPREDEDWFCRLPPAVQEQYRKRWEWERKRFDPHRARNRRRLLRSIGEGAVVFAFVWLLQGMLLAGSFARLLTLLAAGAAAGAAWQVLRADRFGHALIGIGAYFVVHLSLLAVIARGMPFGTIPVLYGAVVVGFASAYRGFRLEQRRVEGTW